MSTTRTINVTAGPILPESGQPDDVHILSSASAGSRMHVWGNKWEPESFTLEADSITETEIADDAVTEDKIADGSVTLDKADSTLVEALTGIVTAQQLLKFRLAIAKTRDGVSDTKILFIGDSITAGNGGTVATNMSFNAYPSRIRIGSSVIAATPTLGLFPGGQDDRFALGTGWSGYAGGYGFGNGSAYIANGAAGNLVYTAGTQNGTYDTYDVYYLKYGGGGTFTATATGGASSGAVDTNATQAVGKVTITAASAENDNEVTIVNTAGQVLILAIESRLSTAKIIRLANAGVKDSRASGTTAGSWSQAGGGLALDAVSFYAPSLSIIGLGTNDAYVASATKATYKTAMQAIINNCRLTGDVVLLTPPPTSDGTVAALITQYRAAIAELAVENGVPVIDIFARFGGTWQTTLMNDTFHPNNSGYWDIGAAVGLFLTSVIGAN